MTLGLALRGWLRLAPWVLLFGVAAAAGWWRYYIAPQQTPLLWAGLAVLLLALLLGELEGALARSRKRRQSLLQAARSGRNLTVSLGRPRAATPGDWLECGVHWLPLVLLLALGPTTLSLQNAGAGARQLAALAPPRAAQLPPPAPVPAPDPQPDRVDPQPDSVDPQPDSVEQPAVPQYRATDLLQLYIEQELPDGTPVEVVGQLHVVQEADPVLPEGVDPAATKLVLYRYVIWCCVADAVPATAVLDGLAAGGVEDEGWVSLRGRLYRTGDDGCIPLLKVDQCTPRPEPSAPYLISTDPNI